MSANLTKGSFAKFSFFWLSKFQKHLKFQHCFYLVIESMRQTFLIKLSDTYLTMATVVSLDY